MKPVALVCVGLFMITSLYVGIRVIGRWLKTRKLPELLLGIALLSIGFFSFALGTIGKLLFEGTESLRGVLTLIGLSTECCGVLALIAFAWRVFHADETWATLVAGLLAACVAGAYVGEVASGQYLRYADSVPISGPFVPLGLGARGLGPAWMAFECFRYHGMLKKRARLGLAEPFVVHRVLLWGLAIGASALAYATSVAHRLVYGTGLREHEWAVAIVAGLALVSALGIALAFVPPRAYRDYIERRGGV
jgi:hypothetical protein